jgi:hypothetical protein
MISATHRAAALTLLATAAASSTALAADTARGIVYEDINRNSTRDTSEPAIPGVLVTNGLDVARTNAQGRYELPLPGKDAIISVIKPAGYAVPTDHLNLPRFYYIHRPDGSPDDTYIYKGVEPTGPLLESIDFPLTRVAEPDRFDVVIVADPQPYSEQEVSFYGRDVVTELANIPAAFAIALGDLVGDRLDLLDPYNEMNALTGHRWHNVYGNHDMNFLSTTDEYAAETYHRIYGPTDYAFTQGKALFIVLDNVQWNGFDGLRADGTPKTGNYVGAVSDRQVQFVINLLAQTPKDHLIVVATHIPLVGFGEKEVTENLGSLLAALSTHEKTLSLSGHTHVQRHFYLGSEYGYTPASGQPHHHYNVATASGTWWKGRTDERGIPHAMMRDGAPNGYAVLSVDGSDYSVAYKAAGFPETYQMNILAPDEAAGTEPFLVNVFNGSERTTVEFRLAGGPWQPMILAPQVDPRYAAMAQADRDAGRNRPLNNPAESTHIWSANLPAKLSPGTHWLEVRATDAFGQVSTDRFPIRVNHPTSTTNGTHPTE